MITALLYIFNAVILLILGLKSYQNYKRHSVNFISKRFVGIGLLTATAYLFFVIDIYFEWVGHSSLSVFFYATGMLFLYFTMMVAAILTAELLSKKRLGQYAAWLLLALGLVVYILNLGLSQSTEIINNYIVVYPDPAITSDIFSIAGTIVYTATIVVLIKTGLANPHIRTKLFVLGAGLFISTWAGAGLAVAEELYHYLITYAALFSGYLVLLIGILINGSQAETIKAQEKTALTE